MRDRINGTVNVRNPALEAFVAEMGGELVLAQVLIRSGGAGFELRHVEDRETKDLKNAKDLKAVAQVTKAGAFRPLKAAPNLRRGWRADVRDAEELGLALNYLYPGAVADWFAARSGQPPVTHYREFTGRQTGMYRITAMLTDERAGEAAQACCDRRFCLKRRLWTVRGLATDDAKEKSAIPCLEPCAIMLEFARKVMRMEQEEKMPLTPSDGVREKMLMLSQSERETLIAALERVVKHPPTDVREADFVAELNLRNVQLLLNKLRG